MPCVCKPWQQIIDFNAEQRKKSGGSSRRLADQVIAVCDIKRMEETVAVRGINS